MLLKQHLPYLFAYFAQLDCKLHRTRAFALFVHCDIPRTYSTVLYMVGYGMNGLHA